MQRPYDTDVFEGLHGIFNDSLPDGWGRLLIDRRARQLGIEPSTLTPLDRLACVGSNGIGALCYAPATEIWETSKDDHARQFSFLMEHNGTWRMAPVYDLTWSFGPGGDHSSSVLGHGNNITRDHLIELGKKADMKKPEIIKVFERAQEAISKWEVFANSYGTSRQSTKLIAAGLAKVRL